jgi:hypothetical protein
MYILRYVKFAKQGTCPTCLQELVQRSGSTAKVNLRISDICCDDAGVLRSISAGVHRWHAHLFHISDDGAWCGYAGFDYVAHLPRLCTGAVKAWLNMIGKTPRSHGTPTHTAEVLETMWTVVYMLIVCELQACGLHTKAAMRRCWWRSLST